MKIQTVASLVGISIISYGCTPNQMGSVNGNAENSTSPNPMGSVNGNAENSTSPNPNTNIVKVLNSVRCHEDYNGYCPQSTVNELWTKCLENGYITTIANKKVISSRSIAELISGTMQQEETRTRVVESTDSNGIVTQRQEPYAVNQSYDIKGYCVGSEYITQ